MTAPASRKPATGGTHGALAGTERRPGGGASPWGGELGGKHHLVVEDPPFPQLFPKDAGQGAALGLGEIRHTELGGV